MFTHHACKPRVAGLGNVLKAIADPTRRRILNLLAEQDLPVSRIADQFSISRWAIMKHLRVLRSANLIFVRRSGQQRIQCLNAKPLMGAQAWISRFSFLWANPRPRFKPAFASDLSKSY